MRTALTTVFLVLVPFLAAHGSQASSPYAGQQGRVVKALSDDAVQDYLAGRGVGLALPAELNRYPGPRHVLDLADSLQLTSEQGAEIGAIYNEMHAQVVPLGRTLVAVESRLDSAFASGTVTPDALAALLHESATVTERLRLAHLRAHLNVRRLLTPAQIAAYDRLRGYNGHGDQSHEGHRHGAPLQAPAQRPSAREDR